MSRSDETLLEVGRIVKAHGIKGELAVVFTSNTPERAAVGMTFTTDKGELTIRTSRPHQQGYVLAFEGISDRNEAERYAGVTLRAPRLELDDDDDVIWIDELFDAVVETLDGIRRGVVVEVMANPASDLMVLDTGHLVPLTFVTSYEPHARVIVDTPDGLFE